MSKHWNDTELIQHLHNEHEEAFRQMYYRYFKNAKYFVIQNSGQSADAEDVFQEALFQLVTQIRKDGFAIHTSLQAFLNILVRNIWFKKIRDKKEWSTDTAVETEDDSHDLELKVQQDGQLQMLEDILHKELKEDCREILLEYYYKKNPLKEKETGNMCEKRQSAVRSFSNTTSRNITTVNSMRPIVLLKRIM